MKRQKFPISQPTYFDPYQNATNITFHNNDGLVDGLLCVEIHKNGKKVFKKYSELAKEYWSHMSPKYGMLCVEACIKNIKQ